MHHFCEVSRKNLTGPHFGDSGLAALGAMSELLQPTGEPEGVETTSAENMRHRGRGRERDREREREIALSCKKVPDARPCKSKLRNSKLS